MKFKFWLAIILPLLEPKNTFTRSKSRCFDSEVEARQYIQKPINSYASLATIRWCGSKIRNSFNYWSRDPERSYFMHQFLLTRILNGTLPSLDYQGTLFKDDFDEEESDFLNDDFLP